MEKPGIIIVDDHRLFRSGLKYILDESGKYKVVAEATNGIELMTLLEYHSPQLVILDINMPVMDGIMAARQIAQKYPHQKLLMLSMYGEPDSYSLLLDLGIKGFILKDADNEEFFLAIDKILAGGTYFSQDLLLKILRKSDVSETVKISRREKEILICIGEGLSNLEIATLLRISQRTVERHRSNLMEKTGSKNAVRLIIFALKNNWITLEALEVRR